MRCFGFGWDLVSAVATGFVEGRYQVEGRIYYSGCTRSEVEVLVMKEF